MQRKNRRAEWVQRVMKGYWRACQVRTEHGRADEDRRGNEVGGVD